MQFTSVTRLLAFDVFKSHQILPLISTHVALAAFLTRVSIERVEMQYRQGKEYVIYRLSESQEY